MAIKKIRLPDGEIVTIDEWLHWPQFSTIEFGPAQVVNLRAFTYVQGQRIPQQGVIPGGARNATETDTNQVSRSRMNHDEAFLAYSVTYEMWGLADATQGSPLQIIADFPMLSALDLRRMQRDMMVSFVVGAGITKPQFRAPLAWIGQGPGTHVFGVGPAPAAGVNISYGTGGEPSPRTQRKWQLPIFIQSDRVMYLQLQTIRSDTETLQSVAVRSRFYLDGLKKRPVA